MNDDFPKFDARGVLPAGDHRLSLDALLGSIFVSGLPGEPSASRSTRFRLACNLAIVVRQLWSVGVDEIYIGGSFVSAKHFPNDVDGYFVCDRQAYKSRALHSALDGLNAFRPWTWRSEHKTPDLQGRLKLPMWHRYSVELFPYYGQPTSGFGDEAGRPFDYPKLFRSVKGSPEPRGVIRLLSQ